MSSVRIPVNFGVPKFRAVYELDGVTYGFLFRINRRDGSWRVTIDRDRTVLLHNVKIVLYSDLLAISKHDPRVPQGTLRAVDLDGVDTEPTEDNFGDRVILVYDEAA